MLSPCSKKQELMLANESDVLVLGGSAGSSKSWMLHMIACKYLDCPDFTATFMRRTTPQLMKPGNLWDTGKDVFGQLPREPKNFVPKWKKGEQKLLEWEHGPVIEYSHCQHEKDLDNYQGSQMTLFAIDEGCQFEWYMIQYLFSRMRSKSKYKSRMIISCNPDPDHMIADMIDFYLDKDGFPIEERLGIERYFYVINDIPTWGETPDELMKKYPDMAKGRDGVVIPPMSFTFIASNIYDNPVLIKNNPGYLSALKGLNDIDRARLLDGNWKVRPVGANYFKREDLEKAERIPANAVCARGFDKAGTAPSTGNKYPDRTASIKMYRTNDNEFYITGEYHRSFFDDREPDVFGRIACKPGKRDNIILNQARKDGPDCTVIMPVDPGSAGVVEYIESAKKLAIEGFIVKKDPVPSQRSKLQRFMPLSAAIENGLVYIVESTFKNKATLEAFYKEMEAFDGERSGKLRKDDWPDSCASVYNYLTNITIIPSFTLPKCGVNQNLINLKKAVA